MRTAKPPKNQRNGRVTQCVCDLKHERQKCGAKFSTRKALVFQMVHGKIPLHGSRYFVRFITRASQCVHCSSVFKSKNVAYTTTELVEQIGTCPTSRCLFCPSLDPITYLVCVTRQNTCEDHIAMQPHLARHSLRPSTCF